MKTFKNYIIQRLHEEKIGEQTESVSDDSHHNIVARGAANAYTEIFAGDPKEHVTWIREDLGKAPPTRDRLYNVLMDKISPGHYLPTGWQSKIKLSKIRNDATLVKKMVRRAFHDHDED